MTHHETLHPPQQSVEHRIPDAVENTVPRPSRREMGRLGVRTEAAQSPDSSEVLAQFNQKLDQDLQREGTLEANNVRTILRNFPVEKRAEVGEHEFFLSKKISSGGREYCIGYVKEDLPGGPQRVSPRLFYKSASEGEWRVSPYVDREQNQQGSVDYFLSKGETMPGGYVRETRLAERLRTALEAGSGPKEEWDRPKIEWLYDRFSNQNLGTRGYDHYRQIAQGNSLPGMPSTAYRFLPGHGFRTHPNERTAREQVSTMYVPPSLSPDFSAAMRIATQRQGPMGEFTRYSIPTPDGKYIWHFGSQKSGAEWRVWPAGVTAAEERVNSYGTSEVLLAGIFDTKPVEYSSQTQGLELGRDKIPLAPGSHYDIITPLLGQLPVIRDFKQHTPEPSLPLRR